MNDMVSIRKMAPFADGTGRGPEPGFAAGVSGIEAEVFFAEDVFRGGKFSV
jgi:hypothetical protein